MDRGDLTYNSCEALKDVLQSPNSYLRELNLSYNKLGVSGIQQLCEVLMHPDCTLEGLNLRYSNVGHFKLVLTVNLRLCGYPQYQCLIN
ncbi:MAG: hypothetical protein ACRCX7_02270 [Cetobacterium sp.]|uniref:leucine-rich repeat domain-containing protein n=1 Tax=Cetobacterium sp. TaxID=2071632 RepID=UPI003F380D07